LDGVKQSFPPVVNGDVRLLVLGSLPGEQSLALSRYYGNPRNQFWRLMSDVTGVDLVPLAYLARIEALLHAGVGLWDTIGSARRQGSLDTAIRDPIRNDLEALITNLPQLRAIGFNGGKSAALGLRQLGGHERLALIPLPSSSPAFTLPYEAKRAEWLKLRRFLKA
jgi:TDG/mug DNA glycosylase family protein